MRWKRALHVQSMFRLYRRQQHKVGLPPGTPVASKTDLGPVRITAFDYTDAKLDELTVQSPEECARFRNEETVTWINVEGIHDVELLKSLGDSFGLHSLLVEDLANPAQLPKFEEYPDVLYVVARMFIHDEKTEAARAEQISLVVGNGFVLSFQELSGDVFDSVRQRLHQEGSRLRNSGADYLAYRLLDSVVDHYFVVLEGMGERLEEAEEALLAEPSQEALEVAYSTRRDLIVLRRHISPLRDVMSAWRRRDEEVGDGRLGPFLRDLQDHTLQAQELVVTYREMVSGLLDLYHTALSTRMNEVMKVLTIISTIFIPLGFLAGLYGMNFEWIPELKFKWGYPALLGVMAAVATGMLIYFRRRRWI